MSRKREGMNRRCLMRIEIKDWLNSQHEWLQEAVLRLGY